MYAQFKELPVLGQIVAVMVLLVVASIVLKIIVGIVTMLIPLFFVAALIVGALWLFDKLKD